MPGIPALKGRIPPLDDDYKEMKTNQRQSRRSRLLDRMHRKPAVEFWR